MKFNKNKICMLSIITFLLLAGCSAKETIRNSENKEDFAKNTAQQQFDKTQDSVKEQSFATASPNAETLITEDEAKSKALEHSGFSENQVKGLRAEFEIDDRVSHYDVQFYQDIWEYEYEIDAQTGAVISFEKDD